MINQDKFFAHIRDKKLFGSVLTQSEVVGCTAILAAMAGALPVETAYVLATAYKETAHTMQPINELGGDAYFFRRYDPHGLNPHIAAVLGNTNPGDGALFHGRGYVQLTGRKNYQKASITLGVDLVNNPDMALQQSVAAKVMREGMTHGWFTGRSLRDTLPQTGLATLAQFAASRSIINGHDCEHEIAGYAMIFQEALA